METKIHIRVGDIEVECVASEDFLKEQLPSILEATAKFNSLAPKSSVSDDAEKGNKKGVPKPASMGMASVAAKLGSKSGSDLIFAAAARLTLIESRETMSRDDLLTEIKKAASYYKSSYASNFTNYLNTLIKSQKLNQVSEDTYSLPESMRQEVSEKLG